MDWKKFAEHIEDNCGDFDTNFQSTEKIEEATLGRIRASTDAVSVRRPARPFKRPTLPQRIVNLIKSGKRTERDDTRDEPKKEATRL